MIELDNEYGQYVDDLKDRLARVKRGEVWGSDHPGPYTAEEKAGEIARIKTLITKVEAGDA